MTVFAGGPYVYRGAFSITEVAHGTARSSHHRQVVLHTSGLLDRFHCSCIEAHIVHCRQYNHSTLYDNIVGSPPPPILNSSI